MSIPTSIICRHKVTWFDSLSKDQLRDLCRAANIFHHDKSKLEMIMSLCEDEISRPFTSITVKFIKDWCRSRSLPVAGLKYQLALRVIAHDCIKTSTGNEMRLSVDSVKKQMEHTISRSNTYSWLAREMDIIRNSTREGNCTDISWNHGKEGFQTPLAAFRDAETIFTEMVNNFQFIANAGTDEYDSLSTAIDDLAFIIVEARVFLDKSEKKAAVAWMLEMDLIFSEYMLGENSKTSLKSLVDLLENDAHHLRHESDKIPKTKKKNCDRESERIPLRSIENDSRRGPSAAHITPFPFAKKKKIPKAMSCYKETVYKEMVGVLRKSGHDSDYVYTYLLGTLSNILTRTINKYEALELFRSAFLALIVHFEKICNPDIDTQRRFAFAIDLLGHILIVPFIVTLSAKKKDETLRWLNDLQTLTRPHGLEENAETPLHELIRIVKTVNPSNCR